MTIPHSLMQLRLALLPAMAESAAFTAPSADAAAPADLHRWFADLTAALDGDNPGPVEPLLAALAQQLTPMQLAPVVARMRSFDFRGAEAALRMLAHTQQRLRHKKVQLFGLSCILQEM
jgi:hypothetical protein